VGRDELLPVAKPYFQQSWRFHNTLGLHDSGRRVPPCPWVDVAAWEKDSLGESEKLRQPAPSVEL